MRIHFNLVYFLVLFVLTLSFVKPAQSQNETDLPMKGVTIICDFDYTFVDYESRRELHRIGRRNWISESINRLLHPLKTVQGMNELLLKAQDLGAEIIFLSARPVKQISYIKKFLAHRGFPKVLVKLASYVVGNAEYKYDNILEMARSRPQQKLIFMGDNLDYDITAFDMVVGHDSMKGRDITAFVRAIRRSVKIPSPYFKFTEGAEIADKLREKGFLTFADVESIRSRTSTPNVNLCLHLFN